MKKIINKLSVIAQMCDSGFQLDETSFDKIDGAMWTISFKQTTESVFMTFFLDQSRITTIQVDTYENDKSVNKKYRAKFNNFVREIAKKHPRFANWSTDIMCDDWDDMNCIFDSDSWKSYVEVSEI